MSGYKAILLILAAAALLLAGYYLYRTGGLAPDALARYLDPEFWSALMQRFYRGIYG